MQQEAIRRASPISVRALAARLPLLANLLVWAVAGWWLVNLAMAWAPNADSAPFSGRQHDCADLVAGAFVYQEEIDIRATFMGVLGGRLAVVRNRHFGSGGWRCLSPDKQDELGAGGIENDAALSAAARSDRKVFDRSDRIGLLSQADGQPIYVYRMSRTVTTHDLVSDPGPAEWVEHHILGHPQRPQLVKVDHTESVLLLVRLGGQGKVDKFGFPAQAAG
jgi:hypothetical protein